MTDDISEAPESVPQPAGPAARPVLERMNPAWFSIVMATGIVAIAAGLQDVEAVSTVLLVVAAVCYGLLVVLFAARAVLYWPAVRDDLGNHLRGSGFFTIVAGTSVLGAAFLVVAEQLGTAKVLWLVALGLWAVLVYAVPVAQILREPKPEITSGITGTWLLWVVATQGVSLLGTQVAGQFGRGAPTVVLLCLCLWLLGIVMYIWVTTLILERLFFGRLDPQALSPTYWITMGAAAISTLAGSILVLNAGKYELTADLVPFLKGMTILVWATATWWIPWLLIMGVWRYAVRRYSVSFEPGWWGMVFPLGMYSTATYRLSQAIEHNGLADLSGVMFWIALGAWGLTFANMIVTLARRPVPEGAI